MAAAIASAEVVDPFSSDNEHDNDDDIPGLPVPMNTMTKTSPRHGTMLAEADDAEDLDDVEGAIDEVEVEDEDAVEDHLFVNAGSPNSTGGGAGGNDPVRRSSPLQYSNARTDVVDDDDEDWKEEAAEAAAMGMGNGEPQRGNADARRASMEERFQGSLDHIIGQMELLMRTMSTFEERLTITEDRTTKLFKMMLAQQQNQEPSGR